MVYSARAAVEHETNCLGDTRYIADPVFTDVGMCIIHSNLHADSQTRRGAACLKHALSMHHTFIVRLSSEA